MDIFIQIIGFVAMFFSIISVQFNKHFSIMFFKALSSFIFAIQYFFLGAFTAITMEIVGVIRNFVFAYNVKKNKKNFWWIIIFTIITVVAGVITLYFSWDDTLKILSRYTTNKNGLIAISLIFSAITIIAKVLSTIGYGFANPHYIRMVNLPSFSLWILHNLVFMSFAAALSDSLSIISIIIAEVRFRKTKNNFNNPNDICNLETDIIEQLDTTCDNSEQSVL